VTARAARMDPVESCSITVFPENRHSDTGRAGRIAKPNSKSNNLSVLIRPRTESNPPLLE
jgi:hypothetical protein